MEHTMLAKIRELFCSHVLSGWINDPGRGGDPLSPRLGLGCVRCGKGFEIEERAEATLWEWYLASDDCSS